MSKPEPMPSSESSGLRILYMEDDPGLARLVQKKLEQAGYIVDIARDGGEGLAMCAAGTYDVVAVDYKMPVHDGLEVIRILASQGPLPPMVMVTGTGDERIAAEAIRLGARDYIVKDVDGGYLELLPTVIEQVFQQQRLFEEKQRVEEALQKSKERYRGLFEQANDVIILENANEEILDANRAASELFGYTHAELLAMKTPDLEPPEIRSLPPAPIYSDPDLTGAMRFETLVMSRDGTRIPVEMTITPLEDDVFLSILRDITERKRTDEALRASEAKNRTLLNAIPDLMFRFNREGACLEVMPSKEFDWVVPPNEMLGKNVAEMLPADVTQHLMHQIEQALKTGETRVCECQLRVNDDLRDYEARIVVSGEDEVLTIVRDITESVRMNEQLERSNARLATLQQINAVIHSGLPLNRALRLVVENIRQGLGYPGVFICLPDEQRGELIIRAASGKLDRFLRRRGDTPTRRISFSYENVQNPLVGAFVQGHFQETSAEPWLQALRDAGVPEMSEQLQSSGVKYGVASPLWHADQPNTVIGVLGILKASPGAFSTGERQMLKSVISQTSLAVHNARLFQAEQQGRREMEALYQAGLAITSAQTDQEVLRTIIEQIVELVEVEGCAIWHWHEDSNALEVELFLEKRGDDWQEHAPPGTACRLRERPTLRRVLTWQSPISLQDNDESIDPAERNWMVKENLKSRLILPLVVRDRSIGILELTESRWPRNFPDRDIRISQGLAAQAAVAMENARLHREEMAQMEREMELAYRIQTNLLPQQAPQVPGLEIAARSVPAWHVGGDFYRYLMLPDGRFGLAIGDVSGKGVPSALFMSMTITAIDTQVHEHLTPGDLLSHLNRVLYPRMQTSRMNTGLLVAVFEPTKNRMQVSNAGMLYPLIVGRGSSYWLEVSGLPIGALPAVSYGDWDVSLGDKATIVFASDGIVEAMNTRGELFGFERLREMVETMKEENPNTMLEGIWQAVSDHIGDAEPHDDITLVVARTCA